jgi:hypothetical protein
MDLEQEKEKARYEHRLEVRKIVIDKVLLGIIVLALGFFADMAIENYRRHSTEQQFFLEQKLDALKNIRKAYAAMNDAFDAFTLLNSTPEDYRQTFRNAIDSYNLATIEYGTLLSPQYLRNLDYHLWMYQAMDFEDVATQKQYREFIYDLYHQFQVLSKIELGILDRKGAQIFAFEEWTFKQTDTLGAQLFFQANYKKWQKSRAHK